MAGVGLEVKRPALRYYGGSWNRGKWTVGHFPAHDVYCEPCFGAGSILFRKSPCKLEIINDRDARVTNFFTVLRERPAALIEQILLTPWAEAEFRRCLDIAEDGLEDARRFFLVCWASVKGGAGRRGGQISGGRRRIHAAVRRCRILPAWGICWRRRSG